MGGEPTPADCSCGAATAYPLGVAEQHADDCTVFEASRERRSRDLAELAQRPPGWTVVRPLSDPERAECEDATGHPVAPGRRSRRRWSVEIRAARIAGRDVLVRVFRRDGEPCGVIVDDTPAAAGAR